MQVTLASGLALADIDDAIGAISYDFSAGSVGQFTFPAVDVGGRLARKGMLVAGAQLRAGGERWDVAAVERRYSGADVFCSFEVRSAVARRLRLMTGPDKAVDVTPAQWIARKVRQAGGTAVVEPGAKRRTIVQKRNESVLDVIKALASDTGVEWCEVGGVVFVGTPWWAFQGKTGLPTFPVAVKPETVESPLGKAPLRGSGLSTRESLDDRKAAAEASVVLEYPLGQFVRPWNRVDLVDVPEPDKGLWLVSGVQFDEGGPDVSVSLQRPLKSSPKDGSSSGEGAGPLPGVGDPGALEGEWIEGADRVWPGCSRTPRRIVEFARAQAQAGAGFRESGCLAWMSIAARGSEGLGGYSARYVWGYAPSSAAKSPGDTDPPIGSIVVWGRGAGGGHGHIGVAVGNGRFISATGGRVQELPIAGFTADYLGAMVPNFGGNYPTYPGAPGP